MARRNIGKEILQGLQDIKAWKRGETRLRVTTIESPRAADVTAIRKQLGMSQQQFAAFMGVSVATLRNWEQRRREPHGPARSLLRLAAEQPKAVYETFGPSTRSTR